MNVHKNARLTRAGRVLLVQRLDQGWSAAAGGVSVRTGYRWLGHYRTGDRHLVTSATALPPSTGGRADRADRPVAVKAADGVAIA